ncbi:hypothetical protein GGR54DRAFT_637899 [Hypoxylon sp. NC1633]|nr:hypothetical protein GGR54DRAFT_637899 [Hypoxylon sp. NC1633]
MARTAMATAVTFELQGLQAREGPSSKSLSTTTVYPIAERQKQKQKGKATRKPWADGPWPLIETPSKTQRISHAALHIANELAHTHNAMLRGLNALYLQAPFVRQPADVADFLFLARVWSAWVLEHHVLKESVMIPGFEAALGLEAGTLGCGIGTNVAGLWNVGTADGGERVEDRGKGKGRERGRLEILLQHVHSYASSALSPDTQPEPYSPATLQTLLGSLATVLVPHLHAQIPVLIQMREFCTPSSSSSSSARSSTHSLSAQATPATPATPATTATPAAEAAANTKANTLTQTFLAAEAQHSGAMDRFAVPPMLVRLRDVTYSGTGAEGAGWPRLSVPALHAVADRLSARHAGAWRFLPCDVWGRPRELGFVG